MWASRSIRKRSRITSYLHTYTYADVHLHTQISPNERMHFSVRKNFADVHTAIYTNIQANTYSYVRAYMHAHINRDLRGKEGSMKRTSGKEMVVVTKPGRGGRVKTVLGRSGRVKTVLGRVKMVLGRSGRVKMVLGHAKTVLGRSESSEATSRPHSHRKRVPTG